MSVPIAEMQATIRKYLSTFGWSREAFIERYVSEKYPDLDPTDREYDDEVRKAIHRLKKHLESEIKKAAPLEAYIDFIRRQPEYVKEESVLPKNYSKGLFSDSFDKGMLRISRAISKSI